MNRAPPAGTLASVAGAALLYFASASLGIWLARCAGSVAVFWPANGLLLGLILRAPPRGRHHVVAVAAGCALDLVALNLLHGDPLPAALGLAAANLVEVLVAHHFLLRHAGPAFALESVRELAVLLAVAAAAPALGAILAAGFLNADFRAPYTGLTKC